MIVIKEIDKEMSEGATVWVLTFLKEVSDQSVKEHPQEVKKILIEFSEGFPEEVPVPDPPWQDLGMNLALGLYIINFVS